MGVDADFSDVEQFFKDGEWEVEKAMIDVGDESVKYAEEHGTYQDHTLNLRTSNKFDEKKLSDHLSEKYPYLIDGYGSSGGGAKGSSTNYSGKKFSEMSETEHVQLYKTDPEKWRKLKDAEKRKE